MTKSQTDIQDFSELRTAKRITVTRKGVLTVEDDPLALTSLAKQNTCLIQDMSQTGFLLLSTADFTVGQILDFSCELLPGQVLECKVEVMHIGDSVIGTRIAYIDEEGKALCQAFLREQFSTRMEQGIEASSPASRKAGNAPDPVQGKSSRSWFSKRPR